MKPVRNVLLSLVAIGMVSTATFAQDFIFPPPIPGPKRVAMWMGDGPGMMLPMIIKKLDLTPDQNEEVRKIMTSHRTTLRSLFQQLEAVHEEMADKLFAPGDLEATDLTMQSQQIQQLRAQLTEEGLKVTLAVRKLLTPEQLAKAAQMKERMKALHAEMRGLMEEKE
jgi:Spy/CpxP family protein refolding chaperone